MSSDANIKVNIDSSSIDDYMAKYNQAMQGKTPEELMQEVSEVQTQAQQAHATVKDVQQAATTLEGVREKADDIRDKIDVSDRTLQRLVGKFVPHFQEMKMAERLVKQIQAGASPLVLVTAVLLAYQIIQKLDEYQVRLEQEKQEMEALIRETRKMNSRSEYMGWLSSQQNAFTESRNMR